MKLDIQIFVKAIEEIPEIQKYDRSSFRNIMGIISGNRTFLKRASLEDIVYYMENLDEILLNEYEDDYPKIELRSLKRSEKYSRRAI